MLHQISGSSFGKSQKNTLQSLGGPVAEAPASGYMGRLSSAHLGLLAGVSLSVLSQPARPLTREIRLAGRAVEGSFRGCCTQPCMWLQNRADLEARQTGLFFRCLMVVMQRFVHLLPPTPPGGEDQRLAAHGLMLMLSASKP